MRRSGHPSRPRARICCFWSSPKMLAIPAGNHRGPRRVNVLGERYLTGRFSDVHDWPVLGVHRRARMLDIRETVTAPRSPWRNAYADRVIASAPGDSLD